MPAGAAVLWALAGLTALGLAIRFVSLGMQSYHHDEVITAARVIPGSFRHMLHEVKASESNPPLYYALAWGWVKVFGDAEFGLRSLTALFGAATVPVAYFAARELSSRRAGLFAAAFVALNPMLIWYSQEARSYALLVFFAALSFVFFVRALRGGGRRDLALWALSSALALCSHYFATFPVAIEAAWLLYALRSRWRTVLPAVGVVAAVELALVPLLSSQSNPTHIGWIENSPLLTRLKDTGAIFMSGETGNLIAEPIRYKYAVIPALLVLGALCLGAWRGSLREKRGMGISLALGVGVVLLAILAALAGKDYLIARNVLPALFPLLVATAIALASERARKLGLTLAAALCAYWLAFGIYVDATPSLQRLDFARAARALGTPAQPRAIVTWKIGTDPLIFYLDDGSQYLAGGTARLREVDVVRKRRITKPGAQLPPAFHVVEQVRLGRLTLTRYMARRPTPVPYYVLRKLPTDFGKNAVLLDGEPGQVGIPGRAALTPGPYEFIAHGSEPNVDLPVPAGGGSR
jgi:4-amino-4-deoxy-L-arabinose transferase-like glycosyltransferase